MALLAVTKKLCVSVVGGSGGTILAGAQERRDDKMLTKVELGNNHIAFRVDGKFIAIVHCDEKELIASRSQASDWATFKLALTRASRFSGQEVGNFSLLPGLPFMPFKFYACRRQKIPWHCYAVKNRSAFEAALRKRGDIQIWITADVDALWMVHDWRMPKGHPFYIDLAIKTVLTLRLVFDQLFRQTSGLVGLVFSLMNSGLPVPDRNTMSRRNQGFEHLCRRLLTRDSLDLVGDGTGLKIYRPGWSQREHFGGRKLRKPYSEWRKLHLGIDAGVSEIVASNLTGHDAGEVTVLSELLDQVDGRIGRFLGDGAYDDNLAAVETTPAGVAAARSDRAVVGGGGRSRQGRGSAPAARPARANDLERMPYGLTEVVGYNRRNSTKVSISRR